MGRRRTTGLKASVFAGLALAAGMAVAQESATPSPPPLPPTPPSAGAAADAALPYSHEDGAELSPPATVPSPNLSGAAASPVAGTPLIRGREPGTPIVPSQAPVPATLRVPAPGQPPALSAPPPPAVAPPQPVDADAARAGSTATEDNFASAPDAQILIEMEIIPVLDRMADRALTLQNAVLRHCLVGHPVTRDALEPAYVYAIEASAAMLPLAFGSDEAVAAPDRLLTTASSTAFSTSKLAAVMQGDAPVPRSIKELANEEAAMAGLPALELLLLRRRYPSRLRLENRCTLAVPVAAAIVDTAVRARLSWLNRQVTAHWQGDRPELASRLRLRDMIQGTIDATDRVAQDLVAYQRYADRKGSALRFSQQRHGLVYLIAAAESLRAHVRRLAFFAKPNSGTAVLLGEIRDSLTVSCVRLLAIATGEADDGAYMIAFEQAHGDIINELPQAFGFDGSAFTRALTSIDVPRAASIEAP